MGDPVDKVDEYIQARPDWQKDSFIRFRALVHKADPRAQEDFKWSVPVFLTGGKLVCAMSGFKDHTKFNFFHGAELKDMHKLFNNGFDSKQHRSIDLREGEEIDEGNLADLLREAFAQQKNAA